MTGIMSTSVAATGEAVLSPETWATRLEKTSGVGMLSLGQVFRAARRGMDKLFWRFHLMPGYYVDYTNVTQPERA